jgi:hypothetical protein
MYQLLKLVIFSYKQEMNMGEVINAISVKIKFSFYTYV